MAGEVLVVAEHAGGAAKRSSLEAMTLAHRVAGALGGAAVAALAGEGTEGAAAALGQHGAAEVLTLAVDPQDANAWAAAVAALAKSRGSALVLGAHSARGKDLLPRIAGRLDAPMASDCLDVTVDGGAVVARRPVYAGKALVTVAGTGDVLVVSLRPNAVRAEPAPAAGTVTAAEVAPPEGGLGATLKEIMEAAEKKLELTEADIIVSGGRGLKGPENFAMIEELAGALGAAVGASRAVVDAGWRPHADQVGQTGKTVSPQLYIAVAISGAIQHLAGMRTSKYIVAINKDPEAPIFKLADYGIVGDAFEVVPALTEAVKKLKAATH